MAYRPVMLGFTVGQDPAKACDELRGLYAKFGTMDAIAKHLEVDRHTIQRWLTRLAKLGMDPRPKVGPKPAAAAPKKKRSKSSN